MVCVMVCECVCRGEKIYDDAKQQKVCSKFENESQKVVQYLSSPVDNALENLLKIIIDENEHFLFRACDTFESSHAAKSCFV